MRPSDLSRPKAKNSIFKAGQDIVRLFCAWLFVHGQVVFERTAELYANCLQGIKTRRFILNSEPLASTLSYYGSRLSA